MLTGEYRYSLDDKNRLMIPARIRSDITGNSVVLTRSRYATSADRSLRFYQEYFQPGGLREIIKHRHRYHVRYRGMPFAINVDEIIQPPQEGLFVEIKSRTWSANDAVRKAELIGEILDLFGLTAEHLVRQDYADL